MPRTSLRSQRSSGECRRPGPRRSTCTSARPCLSQHRRRDERRTLQDRSVLGRPDHGAARLFDATSRGTIEAFMANTYTGREKGAGSRVVLDRSVRHEPRGHGAWFHQGDGLKLWEEAYAAFNLVPRPGPGGAADGRMVPEEDEHHRDDKGLKMRIGTGLGGKVYTKAGGTAVLTPGRRDLRRARARRDRRRRMGRAARRHEAGSAQHRALLLLSGLARTRHDDRVRLQQEGVRGAPGGATADPRPRRRRGPGLWPHGLPREERDRARAAQDGVQGQGRGASSSRHRCCAI